MWFMMKSPARDTLKFSNLCRELPMIQYPRVKDPFLEKKIQKKSVFKKVTVKTWGPV